MATTHGAFMIVVLVVVLVDLLFSGCCASARPSQTSSSQPIDGISKFASPFIILIVFLAIIVFSFLISFIRHCINRWRFSYDTAVVGRSLISFEMVGISAGELAEKIPERVYYAEVKELLVGKREVPECAVCLYEFEDHERLRLLPGCGHAFHRDCIDTWLASHRTCPSCRGDIVAALAASTAKDQRRLNVNSLFYL